MGRIIVAAMLGAVSLASCRPIPQQQVAPPQPLSTDEKIPDPRKLPPTKGHGVPVTDGDVVLEISDQNGVAAAGIPIDLAGPVSASYRSDRSGAIGDKLPKGRYLASIPTGCDDQIQVQWGSSAQIDVFPRGSSRAKLTVEWRHRYRPYPPISSSQTPFWKIGEAIQVQFYVVDQCKQRTRVQAVSFPTYRFVLSPNLELVSPPRLTADANGAAIIHVRCLAPGPVLITSFDSANKADSVDLLSEEIPNIDSGSPVSCRA